MKVVEDECADFCTVNYSSDEEFKTPVRKCATIFAITFCVIGFFILLTSMIVLLHIPSFLVQFSEIIIFATLPFISFNNTVMGIIPTSLLFLIISLSMFLLKDKKHFTFIQIIILIVIIVSFIYYIIAI